MSATFADGEPYWVEVTTPDVPVTAKFYQRLFGWTTQDLGESSGHYTMASLAGRQIAAIAPCAQDAHPWWNVYFKVSDPHRVAKAVESAGGAVLMPPMDVFDQCTIAVCQAPDGAAFGISRPKEHKGAETWGVAGAPAGVTLLAESDDAFDFYETVFGWRAGESTMGSSLTAAGADEPFGNMHVFGEERPEGVRPSWLAVFKSEDVDGFATKAMELGCTVPVGPMDLPGVGRNAFVVDPNGAGFTVVNA
ncbi:VOC family protein [Stackebrandtia nassauensis]|uniref:Glyoxalase/bleomycin resistance protein/dioxygenase n=1 Tax=Stackebrandtia nassauensis (strain DSM 44728 / CIP 108903 / NRRL B-16338 / NBRC 102104 / LLR-40K-21) TaxID=446470 RepID=D3PU10_STANL|nr:VOC family protein [Stackebrandtia nassauensis]ADD40956.1 Glyoxalase/bleomycin resistance protein/dioxygenase [Stackebrandtia nassauensis DSM 44728]